LKTLPTLFISHGAPTFALEPGTAGALLQTLGHTLPKLNAVLIISPHWTTSEFTVMVTEKPATLYDFGGFDPRLNQIRYLAPGHPQFALATAALLESHGQSVKRDAQRGFDHGAWVPLLHLLPEAKVPVFQLSMPYTLTAQQAFTLGQTLQPLSDEGVLIIGSGSITHNLREISFNAQADAAYAKVFMQWVREHAMRHDVQALIHTRDQAPHAARAHPTDEHYLPFLIALGAARADAQLEVLQGGMTYGVIGMDSYIWRV
jgi:4,5-DOPA dioxygenase extradiol